MQRKMKIEMQLEKAEEASIDALRWFNDLVNKRPYMIAMKGGPCTGKSTLANSMAEALKCLVIAQDDVCHSFGQPLEATHPEKEIKAFHIRSFESTCRIAFSQFEFGAERLILDSSLPYRGDLNLLMRLSAPKKITLVVIECQPEDEYEWKKRVEDSRSPKWYKPANWEAVQEQLACSEDYVMTGLVSRIVVNTTNNVSVMRLIQAVDELVFAATESQTIQCIDYQDWVVKLEKGKIKKRILPELKKGRRRSLKQIRHHTHNIKFEPEVHRNNGQACWGCQETILPGSSAYRCSKCDLFVHKSCAELPNRKGVTPQDYPNFLHEISNQQYHLREKAKCKHCRRLGKYLHEKRKHEDCPECLLESFIKTSELPSVIDHPCHEHFLQAVLPPFSLNYEFQCKACGDPGWHIHYTCYDCGLHYHPACCLLPYTGKQVLHRHNLTIGFFPEEAELEDEEFTCNACESYRNPEHWIYRCKDCDVFECHLKCMTYEVQE